MAENAYRWDEIELERLSPGIGRKMINTDRMTVAQIFLDKGAVVPWHHHENEQVSYLLSGKLQFNFRNEQVIAEPGSVMFIVPNREHEVIALEDSLAMDLFAPVRADWVSGEDAYLRNPAGQS